jgi:hypothetical protein
MLNQGPRRDEIVPLLKTAVDLEHSRSEWQVSRRGYSPRAGIPDSTSPG